MPRPTADAPILSLAVDARAREPAYLQLYGQLRGLILSGRLGARDRLPATRALAGELGLSRGTVVSAFELLQSEGYIESRVGAGAQVAALTPEHLLQVNARASPPPRDATPEPARRPQPPFHPNAAALDQFPHRDWARAMWTAWRDPPLDRMGNPDPQGHLPLRRAIAEHLGAWRGIACAPEQVFVFSGMTEGMALVGRALLSPGDLVWLEDPGYPLLHRVLAAHGFRPAPVPIDAEGFDPRLARATAPRARMAVITPSHQYPLGHTMPLPRRLELLDWARQQEGWIVEDDYASEYRYAGRPLSALMSLDERGRVIYAGAFSKVLFPALRLGYVVAPPAILPRLRAALARLPAQASIMAQPALAEFMASGQFAAHVRRMRRLYAGRQKKLLELLARELDGTLIAAPAEAGMHLVARLSPGLRIRDCDLSARVAAAGLVAPALSSYSQLKRPPQGLLLGYAGFAEAALRDAVRRLATIVAQCRRR
ncbi:MAG: PLP-dependent aminotransferase family protein [Alphaproteobacteria bacterium]|nr:PLP-dependent aminotransferase family protein [Alphaproteobacteria bacterium]